MQAHTHVAALMLTHPGPLATADWSHLDLSGDAQRGIPHRLSVLPLLLLSLRPHQVVEVGGQVAPQQRFLRRNV